MASLWHKRPIIGYTSIIYPALETAQSESDGRDWNLVFPSHHAKTAFLPFWEKGGVSRAAAAPSLELLGVAFKVFLDSCAARWIAAPIFGMSIADKLLACICTIDIRWYSSNASLARSLSTCCCAYCNFSLRHYWLLTCILCRENSFAHRFCREYAPNQTWCWADYYYNSLSFKMLSNRALSPAA